MTSTPGSIPFLVMGLVSVISDVFILVLPLPILLKLQASWKRKIGWCLLFVTAIMFVSLSCPITTDSDLSSGVVSSCFVFYLHVVLRQNKTLDSTWNVAASYLTV